MKRLILTVAVCLFVCTSCLITPKKIKVTSPSGNSYTVSEEGLELDIKQLEMEGYTVEVVDGDSTK